MQSNSTEVANNLFGEPMLPGRVCSRCKQFKPRTDFHKSSINRKTGRRYLKAECRLCYKERDRKYNASAKGRRRADTKKLAPYGITIEDYARLSEFQAGLCAICRRPEGRIDSRSGRAHLLHVDHNHATGAVRGLLCGKCNRAIGLLNDDPELLKVALKYLENQAA